MLASAPFASEVRARGCRGGSRTSEAGHWCRRFEFPTPPAASSFRNFKSKSGTRIICLLVPPCFRSSCERVPRWITNFGSGALGPHRLRRSCVRLAAFHRDHASLLDRERELAVLERQRLLAEQLAAPALERRH